jgi:hypothetical protein
MTQQLLLILISASAVALILLASALFRSSARADAITERLERAALARRCTNYDEHGPSPTVRRLSPRPSTTERFTSTGRSRRHT